MTKDERFIKLGWTILEAKCIYYMGVDGPSLTDEEYDRYEEEYKALAKKLNKNPSACNHVGFPKDLPCGVLVYSAIISKGFKYTIKR